ncbi:uncharacterized protein LOC133289096 isoform X2 [Gastrolobium bilobum]|nr:uncharacterized protein LOC133289096 isoform X2 [Gastrolobium bilobum]XP_061342947.1 uncharacterized protein LOC133289096 isoform X2 [Gastrolobium bilobum]
MQEVAGERGGYLHGRGGTALFLLLCVFLCCFACAPSPHAFICCFYITFRFFVPFLKFTYAALDSDDLLYLKEQMEAEEDAERLLRRTEKRAFAAFKRAASLADSSPAVVPLSFRVEPKPKSGIRQQDLLKKVVEIKPKRPRSDSNQSTAAPNNVPDSNRKSDHDPLKEKEQSSSGPKNVEVQSLCGSKKVEEHPSSASHESEAEAEAKPKNDVSAGGLLGLAYASSDDEE